MPQLILSLVTLFIFLNLIVGACAYLILLERKVCAWLQNRVGPDRVGLSLGVLPIRHSCFGLGQPLADGIKLLTKEDYTPTGVDRALFILSPILSVATALVGWAVIPWGGFLRWGDEALAVAALPVNVGVVYILSVGSLAVYGVVLAGYASNNKYAFFGGLRATAQMLSYEIPMSLIVLTMVLLAGTARADLIVLAQVDQVWNVFYNPLLAVIFFTCVLAECNRAPFDLAECEQELIGGFHTEYASMKWALFFLGEYAHMITGSAFFTLLFLGGWDLPLLPTPAVGGIALVLLNCTVFLAKVTACLFVMMWIRWTLPRFRFDQLMRLAWRCLVPVTLAGLLWATVLVATRPSTVSPGLWNGLMSVGNAVIFGTGLLLMRWLPAGRPTNRKLALEGSRFSAPSPA